MTDYVIDASAFLAIIRDEPGARIAAARLREAMMSTVNVSEAFMRGMEKGAPLDLMQGLIAAQQVRVIPFDGELAAQAALLRAATKRFCLSFADRACLATAARHCAVVLTADRIWSTLDLPCKIELIR